VRRIDASVTPGESGLRAKMLKSQRQAANPVTAKERSNVFVRESTGLVKNVSMLDAIALNISNMSAGAALATIAYTMASIGDKINGVNLVDASLIAFVLSLPQIVVYTMMTRRLSRTGGDYIWVSRIYGGLFGSALGFMGYTVETLAYLALIALSAVFAIGSVGLFFYPASKTALGLALPGNLTGSTPYLQAVIGIVVFAILIAINIFRPRYGYRLVSVLAVVGVAALIVGILVLVGAGRSGVTSYMSSLGNSNLTYSAISSSYTGSSFNLADCIFILPFFAIFVYPWINAGPAVASEIKGARSIKWNVPIASFIVMVLVTTAFGAMYLAGGYSFITAALSNPTLVYDYSFNFWTLAMGAANNTAIAWFLGIGWIVWTMAILAYGIIVDSRYFFAQAFDRFLPERVAHISPKYGSPTVALTLQLIVTAILVAIGSVFYGGFQSLYAAVVASMIYFIFVGIAAVIYAVRNEKGSSKGILGICGALMAVVFLYITYQFFANPSIWGTAATAFGIPGYDFAYIYVVGSFLLGVALYLWSKSSHKKKGIDIDLAYKEIPPD
jgi:amino acid transporter